MNKKKLLENSAFYTLSSLLIKAIGFFLLPLYTAYLTPDDYGVINLVSSFNGVVTYIIALSLYMAIVRFVAEYQDDKETLKQFISTVLIFIFCSGIMFSLSIFAIQNIIMGLFFKNILFFPNIAISTASLTFLSMYESHQRIMIGMQQGKKLGLRNIIVFFYHLGLNIIFVVYMNLGATGILLSSLITYVTYIFYMLFDLKKNDLTGFYFKLSLLMPALKYSIPLMPHNLSTHVAAWFSRLFLNNAASLTSVGLYSVATQFGAIIDTVQISIHNLYTSWFYSVMKKNEDDSKKDVLDVSRIILISYSLVYLFIGLFSQEAIIIMTTNNYILAWTAIPILVAAYAVKSIYYFYLGILTYHKEATKKVFFATLSGSVLNVCLSYFLSAKYDMYGVATSFFLSNCIISIITYFMAKKYENVGYEIGTMVKILTIVLLFMLVGNILSFTKYLAVFSWFNVLFKMLVMLIYITLVYRFNRDLITPIIAKLKKQREIKTT
jgi:O-antigen/teichoic acid export membrane protein